MSTDQYQLDESLKSQFRDEYRMAAEKRLWFWNKWRHAESREKKIDRIAEKKLARDLAKGILLQRALQEAPQQITVQPEPETAPAAATHHQNEPVLPRLPVVRDEPIMIPDVPALQAMSDKQFIPYILENIGRYEMTSPAYRPAEEIVHWRARTWPKDLPQPAILITEMSLQFNVAAGKAERQDGVAKKILLMYSNSQEEFVRLGGLAVQYFNKYGKIPQDLRNAFIFEHTKDILRSTPYRKDEAYFIRCDTILMTVYDQLLAGQQQKIVPPPAIKVTYNIKK